MSTNLLIKNILILDPSRNLEQVGDVLVKDGDIVGTSVGGKTSANGIQSSGEVTILDGSGLWISPGFIDLHTHLRDFGQTEKEDVETGTKAAAAGGFTHVTAMANTDPPLDSAPLLAMLLTKIANKAVVNVLPVVCVTKGMKGEELTNMVQLANLGAMAFSDDGLPVHNLGVLRRALEYATLTDKPIISHAEDRDLSSGGVIHEGANSTRLGLPGIPAASETAAIAREIEVTRQSRGRIHFAHVSCAASVELIRLAKEAGLNVTADVTPHHLTLTVDDIKEYDTHFKMNPPLRTKADQDAMVEGLKNGIIDAIATDHAPHTNLEKQRPFDEAPFGVIGLETAFALTLKRLVKEAGMSKLAFIELLTTKPANIISLPVPHLDKQEKANFVIMDPAHHWQYRAKDGASRSTNSPYSGQKLTGKVLLTCCNGKIAYEDRSALKTRLQDVVKKI